MDRLADRKTPHLHDAGAGLFSCIKLCQGVRLSGALGLPPAAAVATAAAAATATAVAAAATTAAATAWLAGLGLVDGEVAAVKVGAVELFDRRAARGLLGVLDEAEATRASGFTIGDECD